MGIYYFNTTLVHVEPKEQEIIDTDASFQYNTCTCRAYNSSNLTEQLLSFQYNTCTCRA